MAAAAAASSSRNAAAHAAPAQQPASAAAAAGAAVEALGARARAGAAAAAAADVGAGGAGSARGILPLTPMWQPSLRTPAPGQHPISPVSMFQGTVLRGLRYNGCTFIFEMVCMQSSERALQAMYAVQHGRTL